MYEKYMKLALELAYKGKGKVSPNPMVGAVIVKDSKIIGSGYHKEYGREHAEINAINSSSEDISGSTMYVTLEPCSHYGKTPPCVDAIIKNKISKVVIGYIDPNIKVCGKGVKKLRENNIEVEIGVLEKECKKINEVFIKYISKKKPFVIMKSAMSLDGKIATSSGESKWISCEESRLEVHNLRSEVSGIMVGVNTIIKDDAELTCRVKNGKNPTRIIVDSNLRVPLDSNVVNSMHKARTIIATINNIKKDKIDLLKSKGVEVIITKEKNKRVDLNDLMLKLGELEIDSILLEGGGNLNYSALEEKIVDKIQIYIAPKIIGGASSKTPVEGEGIKLLSEAFEIEDIETKIIGGDIFIEGYVKGREK